MASPKFTEVARELLANFRTDAGNHFSIKEPGLWTITAYRIGAEVAEMRPGSARRLLGAAQRALALALKLATRTSIDPSAKLGLGLSLPHGLNLSIGPGVEIGERVAILQDVSITAFDESSPAPRIGHDVFIGAGATILGPVTVGNGAAIGPNSLVITDIPPGAFAIGVPAKVVRWKKTASAVA
jgi:serine O-acetyltransferase